MNLPDPEDYVKLFNIKEEVLSCFNEVVQRESMQIDGFPNIEVIYIDGQWFFRKEDLDHYDLADEEIPRIFDLVISRGEKLYQSTKSIVEDTPKMSDEWLFSLFDEILTRLAEYMRIVDIPVYISYFFEGKTLKMMKEAGFSEHDFDILTHPQFNTFHQKRRKDLALLKGSDLTRDAFKRRWAWSEMILFQKKFLDDAFIDEQLSHIDDPEALIEELEKNYSHAKEEFDTLYQRLPENLRKKADLIQKFLYVRDYRFELYIKSAYNSLPLMDEVAKRIGITYEELINLTPDEFRSRKFSSDVKERTKGYVFYKGKIYTGSDVKMWKEHFNKKSDKDLVEGKGVSKGVVQGIAKIVNAKEELDKIEKDDIIVCDITTPDYMHALHKVKAIVANIGGFTSHSAIVAREFGIPCVVGCGNATSVFKDGDMIEVDANKGIVRKLR